MTVPFGCGVRRSPLSRDLAAIPEVLVTLGRTARRLGKLPANSAGAAPVYLHLQDALEQLGRLTEVMPESFD